MVKKQLPIGKILAGALITLLLSGATFFVYTVNQVQMPPSPNSPLLGTWTTDFGRVVNFRPDGTARYRGSSNGKANQIIYIEWMVDSSNSLIMGNLCSSQSSAWKQRLNCWIYGVVDRELPMELLEVTEDGFTVRNAEGIEFKYAPANDAEMEAAP